jgi:hypothetical protein
MRCCHVVTVPPGLSGWQSSIWPRQLVDDFTAKRIQLAEALTRRHPGQLSMVTATTNTKYT